jgi:hypothetical protein
MRSEYADAPYCEIAHQEFEIPQTLMSDDEREAIIEQFRHVGVNLPDDSIKLTVEHRDFHDMLRRLVLGFQADGADATQMLSAALATGRRIGMADAAGLIGGLPDEEWPSDGGATA